MPRYLRVGKIHLKRNIHFQLPDDILVKFNVIMKRQGFSRASDFILYLVHKEIDRYIKEHPEVVAEIQEIEKLYQIKAGR